jgi:hypothetical protein
MSNQVVLMNAVDVVKAITIATPIAGALAVYGMVRSKAYRAYSGLLAILVTGFVFELTFGVLRSVSPPIETANRFEVYFWGYWATYLVCGLFLYFTIRQVLQEVMSPLPGLARLGILAYGWVVIILIIVAVSSSFMPSESGAMIGWAIQRQIERCVGIMELSLLIFVGAVAGRLGLSIRSRVVGVAIGLGIASTVEFMASALALDIHNVLSPVSVTMQLGRFLAVSVWAVYFLKADPPRKPVSLSSISALNRWNEVGMAFGETAVPTNAPAVDFFLSDVEQAVDRVLVKNATNNTEPLDS